MWLDLLLSRILLLIEHGDLVGEGLELLDFGVFLELQALELVSDILSGFLSLEAPNLVLVEEDDHEDDHREDEDHSEDTLAKLLACLVDSGLGLVDETGAIGGDVLFLLGLDDEWSSIIASSSILLSFLLLLLGLLERLVVFDWSTARVGHLGDFSTKVQGT